MVKPAETCISTGRYDILEGNKKINEQKTWRLMEKERKKVDKIVGEDAWH